jgi:hypothetical protein
VNTVVISSATQFYSLEAELRALQLVFLMRSLNELMDYVTGEACVLLQCT